MARGRKKESLTPKERLQAALVPESEQPYEIPGNWCWVKFGQIIDLISGRDAKSTDCNSLGIGIPYILGASNLENNVFTIERWIEQPQVISLKNDILLSVKGTIGKVYLQKEEKINISRQIMSIRTGPTLFPQFTYWLVSNLSDSFREAGNGLIPGISREDILQKEVPLPPASEQQRIVDRIESLFARLDEAKQKVQDALDSFETRKAAILHKAFTGELTARWRKEHGVGIESWKEKTSTQLFEYVTSGSRGWAKYYSQDGDPFIRMGNLDHGTIELDLTDIQYVSLPSKAEGQRTKLQKNDILISITADIGMIGLVRQVEKDSYINQHIALARPAGDNNAEFIAWYLVSDVGLQQLQNKQRGATKIGLGLDDIRSLKLLMPILGEQTEIVRILDDLLAKEQQAKEAAEKVLEQIDLIKKAILARAFRGELGTNDPSEGSAVGLLRQVLSTSDR